jgi:phosphoenolpyruvate carboxylase
MDSYSNSALQEFRNLVGIRFQLYNSLFTSLPFHRIEKTGVLLSLFLLHCEEGFRKKQSPVEIVESFLSQYTTYRKEQEWLDLLFRFTQYAERQVVLFDALEDSAFKYIHDVNGAGTLKHLQSEILQTQKQDRLVEKLKDFSVRLVLTAHPTQFYPGEVLGIINDLSKALSEENAGLINMYLQQLGKTPFLKKQKPTPFDEAVSLLWFLENVFYPSAGRILSALKNDDADLMQNENPVIRMGFWPGGDRDGNPFVTSDITLQVADALRGGIIKCYYLDVRRLKRRLTFKGVEEKIADLEKKLYVNLFVPGGQTNITQKEILETLSQARITLIEQHNGLFLHLLDNLISKVQIFGLHFASLDIRQDSSVHEKALEAIAASDGKALPSDYVKLSEDEKISVLQTLSSSIEPASLSSSLFRDTIESVRAIKTIQELNGEAGCHRYVISHSTSALNVMEVFGLLILGGWDRDKMPVDIVPLFETVEDLQNAESVMRKLYENEVYNRHLKQRGNTQTIMLGFSDGTKDGGYFMANWGIYKAKKELTKISKEFGIDVVFFDGRGGPPARGGGKTHKFYASMGRDIANKEIQLTIQGQTVSSNFGTIDSAQYNIEQLIHAGISNDLFSTKDITLNKDEEDLLQSLAEESYRSYNELKNHPYFVDYLSNASPLRFYAETNIGSRPAKRGASAKLMLKDLRAIPYVGAWSQLKQNVPGYYGLGTGLKKMEETGRWQNIQQVYKRSLYFRTLIDNCEMAMKKCFFPLTEYLSRHPQYGELWNMMYNEFERTEKYLLKLSGNTELMANYPVEQLSISMRERIVLPLATIQQYALSKVRSMEEALVSTPIKETYGKLAMRCSFGIINAGRNSA